MKNSNEAELLVDGVSVFKIPVKPDQWYSISCSLKIDPIKKIENKKKKKK